MITERLKGIEPARPFTGTCTGCGIRVRVFRGDVLMYRGYFGVYPYVNCPNLCLKPIWIKPVEVKT